jgi:hypothetical protein
MCRHVAAVSDERRRVAFDEEQSWRWETLRRAACSLRLQSSLIDNVSISAPEGLSV